MFGCLFYFKNSCFWFCGRVTSWCDSAAAYWNSAVVHILIHLPLLCQNVLVSPSSFCALPLLPSPPHPSPPPPYGGHVAGRMAPKVWGRGAEGRIAPGMFWKSGGTKRFHFKRLCVHILLLSPSRWDFTFSLMSQLITTQEYKKIG